MDFYEKNPYKKKKICINYFDEQEKPLIFFKIFQKRNKKFKAICVVLNYSKLKVFFFNQPLGQTFFQTLLTLKHISGVTTLRYKQC